MFNTNLYIQISILATVSNFWLVPIHELHLILWGAGQNGKTSLSKIEILWNSDSFCHPDGRISIKLLFFPHNVTLDLMTGSYKPYHKPNASLLYVHAQSNHPKSIIKNIPISVNRRLNILSSSEEMFDSVKDEYQEALVKAGHTHVLKYEKVNLKDLNKKRRKRRETQAC